MPTAPIVQPGNLLSPVSFRLFCLYFNEYKPSSYSFSSFFPPASFFLLLRFFICIFFLFFFLFFLSFLEGLYPPVRHSKFHQFTSLTRRLVTPIRVGALQSVAGVDLHVVVIVNQQMRSSSFRLTISTSRPEIPMALVLTAIPAP